MTVTTPPELFRGYDSIKRGLVEPALQGDSVVVTGSASTANIKVCQSVEEVARALSIDASLSVSCLSVASATDKMSFVQNLSLTQHSVTVIVYSSHQIGTYSAPSHSWRTGISAPTADTQGTFAALYGDSFVDSVTVGGEYYAAYVFHTQTASEQQSLTNSLHASGVYDGVSATADVDSKMSSFTSSTSTDWSFDQRVTGITNPALPSREGLIAYATNFASLTADSPMTIGMTVAGYENAPGVGTGFARVAANRAYFLGDADNSGVLRDLASLRQARTQSESLRSLYAYYGYAGDPGLGGYDAAVTSDIALIQAQITSYEAHPATVFTRPAYTGLPMGVPVLDFTEPQPPVVGGNGGAPFDFMPVGDALRGRIKLKSILLAGGDLVDSISLTYAGPHGSWTEKHGGDGGNVQNLLTLDDGVFVSIVSARYGDYVNSLFLVLNNQQQVFADTAGGEHELDWQPGTNEVVLGFRGRCGDLVDQLQYVTAVLQPVTFA